MSKIKFTNDRGEEYEFGLTSFGILDEHNVFDTFNEENDYFSEIIVLVTTSEKCNVLADTIMQIPREKAGRQYRADLMEKIDKFIPYLRQSLSIKAIIT